MAIGTCQQIALALLKIPQVEAVFTDDRKTGLVKVWTVINQDDEAVCNLIYDQERSLIQALDGYFFDFHVVTRNGRPLPEILTTIPMFRHTRMGEQVPANVPKC